MKVAPRCPSPLPFPGSFPSSVTFSLFPLWFSIRGEFGSCGLLRFGTTAVLLLQLL